MLQNYSMVAFVPLDSTDEGALIFALPDQLTSYVIHVGLMGMVVAESLSYLMHTVDNCIQYGEDLEPREPQEFERDDEGGGDDY